MDRNSMPARNGSALGGKKGFTLLEFVIYIAIVGAVLTVAGGMALNILLSKAKLSAIEEVSYNGRFAMQKIAGSIRNAEMINSPVQGSSAPAISLKSEDVASDPVIFDLLAGKIRMQEGLGPIIDLTSSEISVTNLNFSNISYSNTPGTVRIEMTLKSGNFEETIYATENIREK